MKGFVQNIEGLTGKKTGFRLEEFAAPYYVLKDAGAAIAPSQHWRLPGKGESQRRTGF